MKRLLALILALTMVFVLCGCGEKESLQMTEEKTSSETSQQESTETALTQKSNFDDAIALENIKIERVKDAFKDDHPLYTVNIQIRNNYVPADGEPNADRFVWEAQVLDQQGDILEKLTYLVEGLDYGEATWDGRNIGIDDWSSISAIRIKNYNLYKLGGVNHSTFLGTGNFTTPVIFYVDDIDIVE